MENKKRGGLWRFEEVVSLGFDKIINASKVIADFACTSYNHDQNSLDIFVFVEGSDGVYGIGQTYKQLLCTVPNIRERGTGIHFWDSLEEFIDQQKQSDKQISEDFLKGFNQQ